MLEIGRVLKTGLEWPVLSNCWRCDAGLLLTLRWTLQALAGRRLEEYHSGATEVQAKFASQSAPKSSVVFWPFLLLGDSFESVVMYNVMSDLGISFLGFRPGLFLRCSAKTAAISNFEVNEVDAKRLSCGQKR